MSAPQLDLVAAWEAAEAAAGPGWRVQGLRCTSTGLEPHVRGDRWRAEACGPDDGCIVLEDEDPVAALRRLAERLLIR